MGGHAVKVDVSAILDSISELFIATDREWRVSYVNRRAEQYLASVGLTRDDLVGTVIWEKLPLLAGTPFHRGALRAMEEAREIEVEAPLPAVDRWFVTRVAPSPDGMVSYTRDVTARHQAEAAARTSVELIQALIGNVSDPIFAKDLEGRYIMANRATANVMGRAPEEVVGRNDDELFPPDAAARLHGHDLRVLATGDPAMYEETLPTGDGERVFETKKILFRDASGQAAGTLGIARDVTEQRRVATEIQRLNQDLEARIVEFQTLLDVIPLGIAVALDTEASDIRVNSAFAAMLGIDPRTNPSLTGPAASVMRYRILRAGRDVEPADLPIQRAARGEVVTAEEIDVVRADGGRSILLSHVSPLFAAHGVPRGAVGVFLDITERRREERAQRLLSDATAVLNSSLGLDATLAAIAQMAVPGFADCCFVDLLGDSGRLERVELACADGGRRDELFELACRHAPSLDWDDHSIARAIRTGSAVLTREVDDEARRRAARTPDHLEYLQTVNARSLISAPLVARGEVLGALTFCLIDSPGRYDEADLALARELADRAALAVANARLFHAAQVELSRRARAEADVARWAHIFSNAGWGVGISDPAAMAYEAVNPAFARMHGYDAGELIGHPLEYVAAPGYQDAIARNIGIARRRGRVVFESRHRSRDGREFPVLIDLTAVRGESGELLCFATNVEDLTERERAEAQVRQAQKMEALGRLAGGVAHDFNNVLMVIIGFADFISAGLGATDPLRADAEEIRKAAERAAALTRQLLSFGRPRRAESESADLNGVVRDMELMLRSVLGERIQLDTRLDAGHAMVDADRGQLEQVVMNLALNARDAMPDGGVLEIRTSAATFEPGEGYLATGIDIASGDYVLLTVSDTGHGMDAATRARIFEPFFTTRRSSQNSGLGLAVVYGIVSQSRGYLWVDSEPDRGTTFTICFRHSTDEATLGVTAPTLDVRGGTETILAVEDEETVRTLTVRVLTDAGYHVIAARDGQEALDMIRTGVEPNLVLTDVVMPVLGGGDLAERLAVERPALTVLFMSGYTGAELAERGLSEASDRFLQKPFSAESLLHKVRELLDRGQRSQNGGSDSSIMSAPGHAHEPEER